MVDLIFRWYREGEAFILEFAEIYELVLRPEHNNMSFEEYLSA